MSDIRVTYGTPNRGGFEIDVFAFGKYSDAVFVLLNQIAMGDRETCRNLASMYTGTEEFGDYLYQACIAIIKHE